MLHMRDSKFFHDEQEKQLLDIIKKKCHVLTLKESAINKKLLMKFSEACEN